MVPEPHNWPSELSKDSIRILSKFIDDPAVFTEVIEEAIQICRFDEDTVEGFQ